MHRLKDIKELTSVKIVLDQKHIEDLVDLIDEKSTESELIEFLETISDKHISPAEACQMAKVIASRGKMLNLNDRIGECITKASIGNIGDGVSLVVMSVLASLGEKVVKVTSKDYGKFTNTISRLSVFDGFNASVSEDRMELIVNSINAGIYENTGEIVPIDTKLIKIMGKFQTPSIPLLAVSLVAKKIALGVTNVVYDVKMGEGGIFKDKADTYKFAEFLVETSKLAGIKSACVVTALNQPITAGVGSLVELREVVKTLSSGDSYFNSDLITVAREMVEIALILSGKASGRSDAGEMFDECIMSGRAGHKFKEIVEAYGGNFETITKEMNVISGVASSYVVAQKDGYVADIHSVGIYAAYKILRLLNDDEQRDDNAGIVILTREGEYVTAGQKLARITYGFDNNNFTRALKMLEDSLIVKAQKPKQEKLLVKVFV